MPPAYRVIGRAHGEQLDCETMWCPSATLSVWANAWLAGKAAPDDVLDALSCWAPKQSVTAYDAVAAGHTGLPWPDVHDAGAVSLLQTLRAAAGRAATGAPSIKVVLPVPGDVRGLAAGTQFERDALAAGEAVIVTHPDDPGVAVGLVPEFGYDESDDEVAVAELCALSWTVYSLPGAPVVDDTELGEAEYELRLAVRSAADALTTIGLGSTGVDVDDPRGLVEQLLESARHHQVPAPAPSRALRVLENAAHIDAIITVSAGLTRIGTQSLSEAQIATDALRPLAAVVRSARMAGLSAILQAAWQT
jgi:CBS domain-containing protein